MNSLEKEDIELVSNLPIDWQQFHNKVLLISGGTGFIGSFIANVFRYRNKMYGDNVKIVSLSRNGGISDNTVQYLSVDINNPIELEDKVDYILHLASNTHPKQYANDPVGTITTNVYGCNNLLCLAHRLHIKRFLLASSVEIYGQGSEEAMSEHFSGYIDCNDARNGYNESKRVCESLCRSYCMQYGVDSVTVRLARVFGPDKKKDSKAMAQFIDRAVEKKDIILKSLGNQRYSYCYVADAASAIIKVLVDGANGEAYNVAADDDKMTLKDYAEYLSELAGTKVIYDIEQNNSVSKATNALLATDKIKELGWRPMFTVKHGLKRTFNIKSLHITTM